MVYIITINLINDTINYRYRRCILPLIIMTPLNTHVLLQEYIITGHIPQNYDLYILVLLQAISLRIVTLLYTRIITGHIPQN